MNEIIKALTALITPICPLVYFGESKPKYPKIDADLRQLTNATEKSSFNLVLDYYRDDGSTTAVINTADEVRAAINGIKGDIDCGYITIYHGGTRNLIRDNDERIVHLSESYEVYLFKNSEEI